jgi:hypothetical protein
VRPRGRPKKIIPKAVDIQTFRDSDFYPIPGQHGDPGDPEEEIEDDNVCVWLGSKRMRRKRKISG